MLFYIEDLKRRQGNVMCWWRRDGVGYTTNISLAKMFTRLEVEDKYSIQIGEKVAWPIEYIDLRVKSGVVMADECNHDAKEVLDAL